MALGWAIIGTGMHSQLKVAPAMARANGSELVAVYSRDQGRAEAFAQSHGAKAAFSSVADLLADSRVEAVFVASPNALHAENTLAAARAGKHVLTEKPMATSVPDAAAMVSECRANGVNLGVGFELRFHPAHVMAQELISQGVLGRIGLAKGQWGRGERGEHFHQPRTGLRGWWEEPELMGGASVIMGLGVHVIDLMRYLTGQEIIEVSALTDGQTGSQPLEHIAAISLRLSGGAIASVCCGRMLPDTQNDFSVLGSGGRISGRATIWEARLGDYEVATQTVTRSGSWEYDYLANFVDEIEDFQSAVQEGREPRATGQDGVRASQVTTAVIESARTGRAVKISPLDV